MDTSLKELQEIVSVKPDPPETTPSLRDALSKPASTVGCYYFTPSLRDCFKQIFDCAINHKGQGFWIQAEYGAGKTHFLATLTLLLRDSEQDVWNEVRDTELRDHYHAALLKLKLFPVTFSLLGTGETDAEDRLMLRFEKEILAALPSQLKDKVSVTSDDLAVEWYDSEANETEKAGLAHYFEATHGCSPEGFRQKHSRQKFGGEIRISGLSIDLKGAFRERFSHIYEQITSLSDYDGMVFVVDEFRSWQDRHEGQPSFEEGCQVIETLAYYLPVESHMNILTLIASQGECPQKLLGGQQGDRFIVKSLLANQNKTDYGEIVAYRVRDVKPGAGIDIEDYFSYCRQEFKFLRQSQTSKEYFSAIFPFQPRCFEVIRRITQSFERYGLPSARAGINMAYETLSQDSLLQGKRLLVVADLLRSDQIRLGLTTDNFKIGYESYTDALQVVDSNLLFTDDEKDIAKRLIGTLYLWATAMPEGARGLTLTELAEATMTSIEGVTPDDAVLDLITQLRSEIPQIQYDKTRGARFELTEKPGGIFQRQFPALKKKAKANIDEQNSAWRRSLFWGFKDIGGAGSVEGIEGGFLEGLAQRDPQGNIVLPGQTPAKTSRVHRVVYGGEVVVADKWESKFGEEIRDPALHFRLVYLTNPCEIASAEIQDIRIAVCIPASLSDETRENLADLVACDEFLRIYNDSDHPMAGDDRERARARRQEVIGRILKNQIEEFRRGQIVSARGYGILAEEVFKTAAVSRGGREDELAARILEKAYDAPLFTPRDFKKNFTDSDARKVFHGLFAPVNVRSTADNSARDNFCPALGLVHKNNPTKFAPIDSGAIGWIRDRLKQSEDMALGDLSKELCRPPHGLTEDLVTLFALSVVRSGLGDGRSCIIKLREGTDFTLTSGKPPRGGKITSHNVSQVEWSTRLEKALLGARLELSTELSWNAVLDYARVLEPDLKTASSPDEELARNEELCRSLNALGEDVSSTKNTLNQLATLLGSQLPAEIVEIHQRLETIAATEDYQEFHAVVTESYPKVGDFESAFKAYRRAHELALNYPEIQRMKTYLEGVTDLADSQIKMTSVSITGQLVFQNLLNDPNKVRSIAQQFNQFKEKYMLAYRKYHRDYHESLSNLKSRIQHYDAKIIALKRLDQLELGAPVSVALEEDYHRVLDSLEPCGARDDAKVKEHPICQICQFQGGRDLPEPQVTEIQSRIDRALKELSNRVAQGTVRKILEDSADDDIKVLLEVIIASQIDRLPDVLIPEVIDRVKQILRDANLEHRDLPVRQLFGDLVAIEEQEIDEVLNRIRERLKTAFSEAKAETEGKKRIRFFLK